MGLRIPQMGMPPFCRKGRRSPGKGSTRRENEKKSREESRQRTKENQENRAVHHGGDFFTDSGEFLRRCAILNEGQP
jgi:hypothetical protein